MVWLSGFTKTLSRLGLCHYEEHTKGQPLKILLIGSPDILRASGINCQPRLFVDPVLCVAAPMAKAHQDRQLLMPFVSRREKYIISPYMDWLSFFFNRSWRKPMDGMVSLMIKLADVEEGDVHHNKMRKTLTPLDHQRLQEGVKDCREILMRMGAKEHDIFLGTLNAGHPGGMLPLTQAEATTLHSPLRPTTCTSAMPPSCPNRWVCHPCSPSWP